MHNSGVFGMNPYIMGPPGFGGCCNNYARFKVVADKGGLGCCNEEVGNVRYVRKDHSVWIYDPCDTNANDCGWVCIFSGVSMYDLIDNLDGSFTLTENGDLKTTIDMNPYFQKYFKHNILSNIVTLTNGDGATVDLYDKSYIDNQIDRINNTISNIQDDITNIQGDIVDIQGDIVSINSNLGENISSVSTTLSGNSLTTVVTGSNTGNHSDTVDLSSISGVSTLQEVLDAGSMASGISTKTSISGTGGFSTVATALDSTETSLSVEGGANPKGIFELGGVDSKSYLRLYGTDSRVGSYNNVSGGSSMIQMLNTGTGTVQADNGTDAYSQMVVNRKIGGMVEPVVSFGVSPSSMSSASQTITNIDFDGVELPKWKIGDYTALPDTHAVSKAQLESVAGSSGGSGGDTITGVTTTLSTGDVLTTKVTTDDGSYQDTVDLSSLGGSGGDTITGVTTTLSTGDVLTTKVTTDDGSYQDTVDLSSLGGSGGVGDLQEVLDAGSMALDIDTTVYISGKGDFDFIKNVTDPSGDHENIISISKDNVGINSHTLALSKNALVNVRKTAIIDLQAEDYTDSHFSVIRLNQDTDGVRRPVITLAVSDDHLTIDTRAVTRIDFDGVELPKWKIGDYTALPDTHAVSKAQLESVAGSVKENLTSLEKLLLEEITVLKERVNSLEKTT